MRLTLLFLLFVRIAGAAPCELELTVRGRASAGQETQAALRVCSPDEEQRKVEVTWDAAPAERFIPRERLNRYLRAVRLVRSELEKPDGKPRPCPHPLSAEIAEKGKSQRYSACPG